MLGWETGRLYAIGLELRGHTSLFTETIANLHCLPWTQLSKSEPAQRLHVAEDIRRALSACKETEPAHAIPLRLRDSVVGAMNLFCMSASRLSEEDVALGQALADIATIGLLQERAVRQSGLIAEQLQTALNSRILVEQAKGVLLASAGIDVGQAFQLMRDYSRRNNQPVKTVAQSVINRVLTVDQLRRP